MAGSTFAINEPGFNEIAYSDRGPVYRDMQRRGRVITQIARRLVGKKTRRLQRSISYTVRREGPAVRLEVIANTNYALIHHEGTRPHVIRPTHARVLRFRAGGKVVYARSVQHPGTKPNPFLTTAMREAVND